MFEKKDLIHKYTRAQAIQDGELINVTDAAKLCGFAFPVAVTRALWNGSIDVPGNPVATDERLIGLLLFLHRTIAVSEGETDRIHFESHGAKVVAVCGPGDQGEAVMTIGLPADF